jgi:hypothetical protein
VKKQVMVISSDDVSPDELKWMKAELKKCFATNTLPILLLPGGATLNMVEVEEFSHEMKTDEVVSIGNEVKP